MKELSKKFDFKTIDAKWANHWVEHNLFHAQVNPHKLPYTIVIPPPNVTGILHMGHALNNTLQDIIIRYKRMNGFETCWMPGTDHAGIATQNVVEKQIAKEGKRRQELGREKLIERLWEWKKEYGDTIIHQLKIIGASCDWPRTRFTMDDSYSHAVKEAFVRLYEKGLIYRGEYIINWCPRCLTALSDEEAEHHETQGHLYHLRYPFKENKNKFLIIATTRPETMLGDTAVAVNPKDERYINFIGKKLLLPLINREIEIIADDFVDPAFGTGVVKVTPAHDPNDFAMGRRHNLEFINIMRPDASLNENAGRFEGMDRFEARKIIIESLKEHLLLEKIESHTHGVGHCYRCHTVIEPYISKQWFVKMNPLAEPALRAVQDGRIKFYPDRWRKVYMNWMENIRDWCISRQIWWGHRIPVWYDEQENIFVAMSQEDAQNQALVKHGKKVPLHQDEDVLDTWFSSWLWPFATFDWPNKNKDLDYFYPGHSLFTASEIIFFWVARMIMAGIEFMNDIPFSHVYIHGTVRDSQGRKMSKSLGNAIDPLEIVEEYGADALRFSLIINSGQDLFISKEKFEIGRNFANKIWNASRLILMNVPRSHPPFELAQTKHMNDLDLSSKWIISRLYTTVEKVSEAIEKYRYSEAETLIHEFFWNNFCDWYLEIIKDNWSNPTFQNIAFKILETSLKIMHPFIPFVTEELWFHFHTGSTPLCLESWPAIAPSLIDEKAENEMQRLIDLITSVRNLRSQWNIKPTDFLRCHCSSDQKSDHHLLEANKEMIQKLAKIECLTIGNDLKKEKNVASAVVGTINITLPLGDLIDIEKEKKRILTQIEEYNQTSQNLFKRLKNNDFLKKAPKDVVKKEEDRLEELQKTVLELKKIIENLN